MIIDGKKIAAELIASLKPKTAAMPHQKFFGAALVGDDPASVNFLAQKEKVAKELGIEFRLYRLPQDSTTDFLRKEISRLASPKTCGGFIVQLPLPEGVNKHYVLNAIPKEKDLDLLGEQALGAFYSGRHAIVPPSVGTVEEILKQQGYANLRDVTVVVIGAGFLIGKPVGFWLQNRVGELRVFDSRVENVRARLHDADIVISGAGQAGLFSATDLKKNGLVIDFGFNSIETRNEKGEVSKTIVGDFIPPDPNTYNLTSITYTKTPGGTGPILVAKLFENFYTLNS